MECQKSEGVLVKANIVEADGKLPCKNNLLFTKQILFFTFIEIIELEVPKSETLAFLNHAIHEALDHTSDDVMKLKLNDFELGKEQMGLKLESLIEDDDELYVECEAKKAAIELFDKTLTLRNATDSVLEVLTIYKVKKFSKERNLE